MKLQLRLVVLLFLPLLIKGQLASAQQGVVFYSKGKMYVNYGSETDGSQSASTTLYIGGSAEFADGSGIVQVGRTELIGDFVNGKDPGVDGNGSDVVGDYANLFKDPAVNNGVVAFVGVDNKQTIRRTATLLTDKGSQKKYNFISFPTLRVEKTVTNPTDFVTYDPREIGYVVVDTSAAVKINNLVAPASGSNILGVNRFVVAGGYDAVNTQKMNMGQAFIVSDAGSESAKYSQVNLDYYKYAGTGAANDDGFINTANHEAGTGANTLRLLSGGKIWNYLTGFTPPFQEMGADYLFYHVLMKPNKSSLTSNEGTIVDPSYKMKAGLGYFMTMDLTDYGSANIDARWSALGIAQANRARGGVMLNRQMMRYYFTKADGMTGGVTNPGSTDYMKSFARFSPDAIGVKAPGWKGMPNGIDKIELLTTEKFKTDAVSVSLVAGLNFLGNPFMAPISLNPLLGYSLAGNKVDDAANVMDVSTYFGANVKASNQADVDQSILRSKYWVINNGLIRFDAADNLYHMKVSYDYISTDGTTVASSASIANPVSYLVAPMQMFVLQASRDFTIQLSPNLRTFGTTRYLKSANNSDLLSDFFVVEVVSSQDKTADRTAVVLRDQAKMNNGDNFDTTKSFSDLITLPNQKDKTYPEEGSTFVYTRSSDGKSMLGNAVPLNVKELALYVASPATQQAMSLNFYNLENMTSVSNVWLVDRYQDNKTVKLTPGHTYEYTAGPSDLKDIEGSRFILRFYDNDGGDILGEEKPITAYYNTSVLHISGLNEKDVNSDILIYDMQGRLMGKAKVNNYPSMEFVKPLSLGTYIVKISGERNFTTKFVNLQN